MHKTEKYQLPQWEMMDRIMMEDFNAAMSNIESGIQAVQEEAKSRDAARAVEDARLDKKIGGGGHTARIAWGSYAPDSSQQHTLTFDFMPVAVFVGRGSCCGVAVRGCKCFSTTGSYYDMQHTAYSAGLTWEDLSLTLSGSLNETKEQIWYVAIGVDKVAALETA